MMTGRDGLRDETDDDLSLQPLLRTLWSYRRTMAVALTIAVTACVVAALLAYARAPRERLATLGFQLMFDGADQNRYPNGTPFSGAELVSTPVLSEVFTANELQRYATFADFKDSMFVLHANRGLELLSYEYQGKLADPKLTAVDRARLEEEFRTKAESIRSAQYSLNIRRSEGLVKVPAPMLSKVLQDTLSTWSNQAAERRGVVRYDLPILSKNALQKDLLASEDYIVAVDILRTTIERILNTLDEMAKIPGASAIRMGREQVSLADLRASLEDQLRFKVEPLMGIIRASGLSRNRVRMDQYFGGRLFEVRLAQQEATQRIRSMQEALRDYEERGGAATTAERTVRPDDRGMVLMPQLSDSFIDKLVDLSTRAVDIKYRQDLAKRIIEEGMTLAELNRQAGYYESMQESFASSRTAADSGSGADVSRRTNAAFDELARLMDQIQAIYELISRQNLNPDNVVYAITQPFTERTISSLSVRTILLYMFVTLCVAVISIPLGCLAHYYFRSRIVSPVDPSSSSKTAPTVKGTEPLDGV